MPIYRTKGEIRSDLLALLGYGGLGASAANFVPYADVLLEKAQKQLFLQLDDFKRTRSWDISTGLDQQWYDFPPDCDPERIRTVRTYNTDQWLPVTRGIESYHDSIFDRFNEYPRRYDLRSRTVTNEELQSNGDFSVDDSSAEGGTAGWSWNTSKWEIASGVASHISAAGSLSSTFTPVVGDTYTVTYTIGAADAVYVKFGEATTDTSGTLLPFIIGTHTVTVVATDASYGLRVNAATVGCTVSSVSTVLAATTRSEKLELWPKSSTEQYTVRIEGVIQLMPFVQDGDRATIDDLLILQHATAYGKAHLNKPDAQLAMLELRQTLALLRGQQHGELRYIRGEKQEEPLPMPRVV